MSATTRIYTMRELNQRTSQVIDEIRENGEPAFITYHGRLIAIITPVTEKGAKRLVPAERVK